MACVAARRYQDAFETFLLAIEGGSQPEESTCTALVQACAESPEWAASAFAVFTTMCGAGMHLDLALCVKLARTLAGSHGGTSASSELAVAVLDVIEPLGHGELATEIMELRGRV